MRNLNPLRNFTFDFGYNGETKYEKFTYKLCEKFPWVFPTIEIKLFQYKGNGSKAVCFHDFYLGYGDYYWNWSKIYPRGTRKESGPYWCFRDLSARRLASSEYIIRIALIFLIIFYAISTLTSSSGLLLIGIFGFMALMALTNYCDE